MVSRRLLAPIGGVFVLLLPTLGGGSDASALREARLVAAIADDAAAAQPLDAAPSDEVEGPVELWTPGHGPHTSFKPASAPRELLLSFDDGPDLKGTPIILDELDRRGLKAIFFVTGWRLAGQRPEDHARRELVRKIAAHGHLVANHTFSHHDLCQNPAEQAVEIDSNSELITATTGVRPLLFRSPYGAYCRSLDAALALRGLPDIGWNIDPQDWKNKGEEAVYSYLVGKLSHLKGRGILLLHDTHPASVSALPRILDWLAHENRRDVDEGRPPVTFVDYGVVVPRRPLAVSGVERVVGDLLADVGGSLARFLP
jgi:peptidoglycan/xylan/chitin deacetylase (PgdA/CDA1 family)